MCRAATLAATFLLSTLAVAAADLPPDMSAQARAAFIKDTASKYKRLREGHLRMIEEAKAAMKIPATEQMGKKNLQAIQGLVARIDRAPWMVGAQVVIGQQNVKKGDIALVSEGAEHFGRQMPNGVLVEDRFIENGEKGASYLIASKFELPKDKNAPLKLDGLWYVAGETELAGKKVPVIYALVIKPEEVTRLVDKP